MILLSRCLVRTFSQRKTVLTHAADPASTATPFGAVKASGGAHMAIKGIRGHEVSFDELIRTLYQTGLDIQTRPEGTGHGGIALSIIEC